MATLRLSGDGGMAERWPGGIMVGRTVGGMVSLATHQTPVIHDNNHACVGIMIYLGVWWVAKLTIPPSVPPAIPATVRPTILPAISPPIPSSPNNPATHQLAN